MTAEKITMPQLGESVTEGTISTWLVKAGDQVNKYDPIAEVMTDKVNAEVPSSFTGVIKELTVNEGDTVAVGELICYIDTKETSVQGETVETKQTESKETPSTKADDSMKKRYSPAVLRLAQDNNIDLEQVTGSGRGGRITRKDIEKIIASGDIQKAPSTVKKTETTQRASAQSTGITNNTSVEIHNGDIEIPVKGVRKVIAENMVKSKQEIPHAWMTVEVDVTDLVTYRNQVKDAFKKDEGFGLTYFAFFVKAVSQALKEYPPLNSMWAGDKIIQKKIFIFRLLLQKRTSFLCQLLSMRTKKRLKPLREIYMN